MTVVTSCIAVRKVRRKRVRLKYRPLAMSLVKEVLTDEVTVS